MKRDLTNFNLTAAMKSLYTSGEYFAKLRPQVSRAARDNYWDAPVDPDGVQRDRLAEKDQYLQNLQCELGFISHLEPGKILDIGCGPGWLLSAIDDGWCKYGVEPSAQASSHASRHGEIFIGPFEEADYPNDFFDLVIAYHVIEHMENPATALRNIRNILRPGGAMVIGTPDFDSGCARHFGNNYRLLQDPTHISLFSTDSMHRCLRDAGFEILEVEYPFFSTTWFKRANLLRCFDIGRISPPAYGNFMTFYCRSP